MVTRNRIINSCAAGRFNNPIDRYQSLSIKECLSKPSQYFFASKQLSFLLKNAYSKFPKNLQSLIFQDTIFAFRLLPEMQTQSAISAANSLLQSAEFALPKQKRALAVTEHKHAVVASKRKSKTNKEEDQLPQDVLVHMFGFLDVKSLLSASAVCRSWNGAAGDNCLWKLLYDTYFNNCENVMKNKGLETVGTTKNEMRQIDSITAFGVNYRFAFEAAYKDEKLGCCTGYCSSCRSIVWLNRNRCSNQTGRRNEVEHQIMPMSIEKIDDFILNGFVSSESSSYSDSDTDDEFALRLWAYPRQY
ncbi:F-box protein At5g52880-like isoform X2 [Salvia splendens]|uniref:F-box protein At5g52880-like isoform X2 n=1 Tax=Salvia splendens TaxID=180675 RepID=UPI001C267F1F|nr:F-box protein At5g52880-like isoform X2 [Salvia splendens]